MYSKFNGFLIIFENFNRKFRKVCKSKSFKSINSITTKLQAIFNEVYGICVKLKFLQHVVSNNVF